MPTDSSEFAAPVSRLYGVGAKQQEKLLRLGIRTLGELVFHLPRRYEDFSQTVKIRKLVPGRKQTVQGTLWQLRESRTRQGRGMLNVTVVDGSGVLHLTWFNPRYVKNQLKEGMDIVLSGEVSVFRGQLNMVSPAFSPVTPDAGEPDNLHVGRILPVYPETDGISSRWLRQKIHDALALLEDVLNERLPPELLKAEKLPELRTALKWIHFPSDHAQLTLARKRFGFEELFYWQLKSLQLRQNWESRGKAHLSELKKAPLAKLRDSLPFELTGAQKTAIREILEDMAKPLPMARLLEGDVGAGKTVVAAMALLNATANGHQSVLMAPTEILAEQHFQSVRQLLSDQKIRIALMTSAKCLVAGEGIDQAGMWEEESAARRVPRSDFLKLLSSGEIDIVFGTQSLIQADVRFVRLALVVIDEQHRFGIAQRDKLAQSKGNPDLLAMTATPIPRTLALAVFGDLELSILDELPAGRQPILSRLVPEAKRAAAYDYVRGQLDQGNQAFVVCPLIENSETLEVRSATDTFEKLSQGPFSDYKVGLLHGRLKSAEKEAIIRAFRDRALDMLVSTAVIEVGVDIPNATIMMIEGADRFGLAQLHQFRGRVGRGDKQSYCFLFTDSDNPESVERLKTFVGTQDGFALAEADLKQRGPGQVFGLQQSGMPDLPMSALLDTRLLKQARAAAERYLPRLHEFPDLKKQMETLREGGMN